MHNWLGNTALYEINVWVWLREWSEATGRKVDLGTVPDEAWDQVAAWGFSAVWLMGVWERSPAGLALARRNRPHQAQLRHALPRLQPSDLVGSPYAIRRYQVDPQLGGPAALAQARKALARRGIRLILDFVPNHLAIDHPWAAMHPDWFIQGDTSDLRREPDAFFKVGNCVLARGRDPYFPPWSDVLQLNVFNPELRAATLNEVRTIASQCDGVRCDMAMLVLNQVFARTWGERAGAMPAREYWLEIIPAVQSTHPEFRWIAEGYWDLETTLLGQGFNACYDKGLYDRMAHGIASSIREHVSRWADRQAQLVRFLENHDERRAAEVFSGPKGLAAFVVLLTLPGIRLIHEGQLEGRLIRTSVHLQRRANELEAPDVTAERLALLALVRQRVFHTGRWSLCTVTGWPDNSSYQNLLSWGWRSDDERWLIVVNYSHERAQGRITLPWNDLHTNRWRLVEFLSGLGYDHAGDQLLAPGLFVDLGPWEFHVFSLKTIG